MTNIIISLPTKILGASNPSTRICRSRMQSGCAGDAECCLRTYRWQVHSLEHELPDGDDRAYDQEWIDQHLQQVATSFFRAHQKRVGRFMLVFWFIDFVCYCFHAANFKRRRLAAMTMIIKFLPLVPYLRNRRKQESKRYSIAFA